MTHPDPVALLAMPDVTAATLYGFHDCFAGVHRDWSMLHGGHAESPFRPVVVSRDGEPLEGANGVRIGPAGLVRRLRRARRGVRDRHRGAARRAARRTIYDAEVAWLRERHAPGSILASSCSGALLLARTGLLEGQDATSHWAYCDALKRDYPARAGCPSAACCSPVSRSAS